jgi:hypothetical protein
MRAPRRVETAPEQDRERDTHKHEIYPRMLDGVLHDRDKKQRQQGYSFHLDLRTIPSPTKFDAVRLRVERKQV